MKVLGVVLLSVCVIAKAEQGGSLSRSLGDTGYHVIFQAPNSAVTADDVAALYHTFSAQERFVIAGQIEAALENFRDVIINGNAFLPVLDPFTVDLIGPYQFNAAGVGAQGSISNLRVEGLRWYLVDRVTFNALRMTFGGQITVPWIITTGSYDAQARVAILNHRAGGNFRLFLSRLVMSVDARLGTNIIGGGHLFLRELAIKIDIHDTYIQIDGMVGSSWLNALINSFLQSITQQVIQEHMETLSTVLSEQLFDIINALLKGLSL